MNVEAAVARSVLEVQNLTITADGVEFEPSEDRVGARGREGGGRHREALVRAEGVARRTEHTTGGGEIGGRGSGRVGVRAVQLVGNVGRLGACEARKCR